ncbi:MAG: hypothetical protein LBM16_04655 [Clostridiales bacterium]|jgi:hypothetical protein|nr:hypothetical protein [Clostridiales bacterium]
MKIFNDVREIFAAAEKFEKTTNYYFQRHMCVSDSFQNDTHGNEIKVNLDFSVKCDKTGEIANFGICPNCKTVFYYEGYTQESL